jgi:hypothetical protein
MSVRIESQALSCHGTEPHDGIDQPFVFNALTQKTPRGKITEGFGLFLVLAIHSI